MAGNSPLLGVIEVAPYREHPALASLSRVFARQFLGLDVTDDIRSNDSRYCTSVEDDA